MTIYSYDAYLMYIIKLIRFDLKQKYDNFVKNDVLFNLDDKGNIWRLLYEVDISLFDIR